MLSSSFRQDEVESRINQSCTKPEDIDKNCEIIEENISMKSELVENNRGNFERIEGKNDIKSEIDIDDEDIKEENMDSSDDFVEVLDETKLNSKLRKRSKRKRDALFDQKLNDFMKDRKLGNITFM